MIAAAAIVKSSDLKCVSEYSAIRVYIKKLLEECKLKDVNIVVFPGLLGSKADAENYINDIAELSKAYKSIYICPGTFFERHEGNTYHSSCIIKAGKVILKQRQIYLSKWEREIRLARGNRLEAIEIEGFKMGMILPTDAFYPQISRQHALSGVNLVLAPTAIAGGESFAFQLSGIWQNVQQNLFFAVESCFKGKYSSNSFFGRSAIHAPLEMTNKDTGFMALEPNNIKDNIISAKLDNELRKQAVKKFDTVRQMNREFYKGLFK